MSPSVPSRCAFVSPETAKRRRGEAPVPPWGTRKQGEGGCRPPDQFALSLNHLERPLDDLIGSPALWPGCRCCSRTFKLSDASSHRLNCLANSLSHVCKRLVSVRPPRITLHPSAVLGAWRMVPMPIARSKDSWDDPRLALIVASQSTLHLFPVAVIGGEEQQANQQEDNPGRFQVLADLIRPFRPSNDLPVVPTRDDFFGTQQGEMLLQLFPQFFVFVRV